MAEQKKSFPSQNTKKSSLNFTITIIKNSPSCSLCLFTAFSRRKKGELSAAKAQIIMTTMSEQKAAVYLTFDVQPHYSFVAFVVGVIGILSVSDWLPTHSKAIKSNFAIKL